MKHPAIKRWAVGLAWVALGAQAGVDVTQSRYDLSGTGANPHETLLHTGNVNPRQFGLLGSYPVDGDVYAQPLFVSALPIAGKGLRNVVYIATMQDVIYAYDADSTGEDSLLWKRDLRNPAAAIGPVPVVSAATNRNIRRYMGIESTPVIDRASGTLYLVARTLEQGRHLQRLHALDLATGADKSGSPVTITADYRGLQFNPRFQHQRAGLVIASGQVILCWAADAVENTYPYHGWVMSYDAATLEQTGRWTTTTTRWGGGIWASGRAPAVIDNPEGGQDVIVFTGNAIKTDQGYDGRDNFAESMLRLRIAPRDGDNAIRLVDWFTPHNWLTLDKLDLDLGGSGPVILPGSGYIVGGGKQGILYVVDPDNMGKLQKANAGLVQSFRAVPKLHIMGGGVVWDRSSAGLPLLFYNWGESDFLKAFTVSGKRFDLTQTRSGKEYIDSHPGGILTLSSNGAKPGSGIVWAAGSNRGNAIRTVRQGILRAYDAADIRRLLWSSRMNTRDDALAFAKFTPPTVAAGKVYLATFSDRVLVYGLLPSERPRPVYVALQTRQGHKRLESALATRFPGAGITVARPAPTARQRFELAVVPTGGQAIRSAFNGLVLDEALSAEATPASIRLMPERHGIESVAQTWTVVTLDSGYVRLLSGSSGRALSLGADGKTLETRPPGDDPAQDWTILRQADAGVTDCDGTALQLVSAAAGNPLVGLDESDRVRVQPPDQSETQQWMLGDLAERGYGFYNKARQTWLSAAATTLVAEPDPETWLIEAIPSPLETFNRIHSSRDDTIWSVQAGRPTATGAPIQTIEPSATPRDLWRIQDIHSIECLE